MIPSDFPIPTVYRPQEAFSLLPIPYHEAGTQPLDVSILDTNLLSLNQEHTPFILSFACIGRHKRSFETFEHFAFGSLYTMEKK